MATIHQTNRHSTDQHSRSTKGFELQTCYTIPAPHDSLTIACYRNPLTCCSKKLHVWHHEFAELSN